LLRRRAFPIVVLVAASLFCRVTGAQDATSSETFCVNAGTGDDANPGTKEKPLRTILEAARRVTEGRGSGPTTVVISEGVHVLDKSALFKPARACAKEARLVIRAEVHPDGPDWNPARMPVVISTMPLSKTWMGRPDPFGGASFGHPFIPGYLLSPELGRSSGPVRFTRPDKNRQPRCALRSDDTEAIWGEASNVASYGRSCTSRRGLGREGG
jgi:hypothetical protein